MQEDSSSWSLTQRRNYRLTVMKKLLRGFSLTWFTDLSRTAQGIVAVLAIVSITVGASTASMRLFGMPAALEHIDLEHTIRLNAIELFDAQFEETTSDKLDDILRTVENLDLRLCLEQSTRDGNDPRLCAQQAIGNSP